MKQYLRDITVHRMVLIALAFISIMILTLSAVGLKGVTTAGQQLDLSYSTLQQTQALSRANDQLLHARLGLIKQEESLDAGDHVAGQEQAKLVRELLEQAKNSFNDFLQHASVDEKQIQRLKDDYNALADNGLGKLLELLQQGNVAQYKQHHMVVVADADRHFSNTVNEVNKQLEQHYVQMLKTAQSNRIQVMVVVAVVLIICLILMVLADRYIVYFVRTPLDQVKAYFQKIADGDLTFHIEPFGKNCPGQIYPYLIDMKDSLANMVRQVRNGVEQINTGTSEIAVGNNDLYAAYRGTSELA